MQVAHDPGLQALHPVQRGHAVVKHVEHARLEPVRLRRVLETGVFALFGILLDNQVQREQRLGSLNPRIDEPNLVRGDNLEPWLAPLENKVPKRHHVSLRE